ncbi:DUF58 domain-containing protein [Rhodopirellula halodulae]|uniref:DUF58 domain-containing protein n=1 Tax=Rhodopirellula halodulae TaxID=2894198 RepID=UPI001E33F3C4|nr:DUF58 domain-containing protein [Rhodopirellula sp. JC737]MCC9656786.1 DUF58 domain-containing protein [Rhodopirellula sp. JC737]
MSARVTVSLEDLLKCRADARGFSLTPRQPVGSLLAGRHASRLRGRGLSFEELRSYRQGDDIRLMDWKATARLRSPHLRVYSEERERPVLMLVDQRQPMFFGSQVAMKSVVAAELAAIGVWRSLSSGDRVGGLVFNETEIAEVRPHRSQSRVLHFLHQLVRLNQKLASKIPSDQNPSNRSPVTLNQVLENASRIARHDHLVILVSDLDGADEETSRLVTRIAAHNDVLVVAVYDPLGIRMNGAPGMIASDGGTNFEIPDRASFPDEFQHAFGEVLSHWRDVFRSLRIPLMPLTTARPVAEQIRALFGNTAS